MEMSIVSVVSVQLVVVLGIAAALLLYLMRFRRSNCIDVGHKAVLVTDCDGLPGRMIAFRLHGLGFRVFAACAKQESSAARDLRAVATQCTRLHVLELDPLRPETVVKAVEEVEKNLPADENGLWALINTRGSCVSGLFEWQTWEQCEGQVAVNLLGALRLSKAFLHLLRPRKGRIISVSVLGGQPNYPGFTVYAATKAALESFYDNLQMELEPSGVRAITVAPAGDYREQAKMLTEQEHVDAMWNNMSLENKSAYGNVFQAFSRRLQTAPGDKGFLSDVTHPTLAALLADVESAVVSKFPQAHYTSAPLRTKLWMRTSSVLPSEWKRQKLMKQFHRNFLSEQMV